MVTFYSGINKDFGINNENCLKDMASVVDVGYGTCNHIESLARWFVLRCLSTRL